MINTGPNLSRDIACKQKIIHGVFFFYLIWWRQHVCIRALGKQGDCVNFLFNAESMEELLKRVHQQKGVLLLSVTGLFSFHRGRLWGLGIGESCCQLFWHCSGWSMVRCKLSNRKDRYYRIDTGLGKKKKERKTYSRDIALLKRELFLFLSNRQKCVRVMELLYPFIN